MKLGIHAYAWCSRWTDAELPLIDRVRSLGLDFIEIPLMSLETLDAKKAAARLKEQGIGAVTSTVLLGDTDITSEDPAIRKRGVDYLIACARATRDLGASQFSGVIYSQHIRVLPHRPRELEWERSAEALRTVARAAADCGVTLALEPVNRYETFLVNTCAQARDLARRIGEPNVKIHLDTYHMNIEEKSFADAALLAGGDLVHLHLCENDRGIPGTGLVDWDGLFAALGRLGYRGHAALESFVDVTDNMNTWVWRQLAPSGDALVKEGLAFIRAMARKHGLP